MTTNALGGGEAVVRKMLGWVGFGLGAALVLIVTVLVGGGIPKPPALTTENVGRVGWGGLLQNVDLTVRSMRSKAIAGWMPDGERLLVRANYLVFDSRLHLLPGPRQDPSLLRHIPRNASTIATQLGRDHVIFSWDEDGDEQFQLYRWDLGDSEPVRLTTGSERAFFGAYEPSGDRFAFGSNRRNGADMDLYVADPRVPGSEEMVFEAEGTWGIADWSPVDDALLLVRMVSNVANEIYTLALDDGRLTMVSDSAAGPVAHGSVQWTDDGSALYLVSDRKTEFRHLRRLDLETGEETILSDEIPWDVSSARESGDGSFVVLVVNVDGRDRLYVYDVAQDRLRPLDLFSSGLLGGVGLHPERPLLTVNHVDASGVVRGYLYDLSTEELTLWVGPDASTGAAESGQQIRYPTFDTADGKPRLISAFVYPGVGKGPRPVIIDIHGGPEAQARLSNRHTRTQRAGITVITPNVRGSTGYGKSFTKLDDGYLREDAVRDIGALLEWIESQPSLDGERVGVTGGSYGGYMVLASLVHFGERIRCGVDVVGISNFVTFLENTADYRRDLRRAEYGDERDPQMRAFLESISPLTNAERIVSPLMVVQGANDPRVPVNESRQMVERVQGNGLEVGYIEGANEGHGFRNPWNSLYAGAAQFQMMEACLAG